MIRAPSWRWVLALWALSTLCALFLRPITPIDETRYLAVAWEMFRVGDPWLPTLNGVPYSDKPPLLFWLINAGWAIFGVGDVWPRLMTAVFGFGVALLTARCAVLLCGSRPGIGGRAALALTAFAPWLLFNGAVMFDVLLTFFTLAAIVLVLGMRGAGSALRWGAVGLALGLGLLAKGPVALLHAMPLALLAPLWKSSLERLERKVSDASRPIEWGRWYGGVALALVVSLLVLLVWIVPAINRGGSVFLDQLIWQQTIDRMATTTHHLRPAWFYVALLPVLTFPWWLLPSGWRGARGLPERRPALLRVIVWWILPVFVAFSLFRGKQLHYLFPLLPAFAVLLAAASSAAPSGHRKLLVPAAKLTAAIITITYAVIVLQLDAAYDVRPMARRIADVQRSGVAVANAGRYHGQFQFAGRLTTPLTVLRSNEDWQRFKEKNPAGYVVTYSRDSESVGVSGHSNTAVFRQKFRSRSMALRPVDTLASMSFAELETGVIRASLHRPSSTSSVP